MKDGNTVQLHHLRMDGEQRGVQVAEHGTPYPQRSSISASGLCDAGRIRTTEAHLWRPECTGVCVGSRGGALGRRPVEGGEEVKISARRSPSMRRS